MKLLALDTSTEALSVAVTDGANTWEHTGAGGAQASATLLPVITDLLAKAGIAMRELDAIAFGRGPGSFTGLRTACAVAQGLGFGAGVKLLPVDSLLALAEEARSRHGASRLVVVLDARMDQVYTAAYDFSGAEVAVSEPALMSPDDVTLPAGWSLAGNAFAAYGSRLPDGPRLDALPTAAAMLRLSPKLLAAGHAVPPELAFPVYIRDKVAQTTEERMAARARANASPEVPLPTPK